MSVCVWGGGGVGSLHCGKHPSHLNTWKMKNVLMGFSLSESTTAGEEFRMQSLSSLLFPPKLGILWTKPFPLFQPTYVSTEALGQAPACPGLLGPRERAGFGISPSGSFSPPRQRTSGQGPGIEILKSRSHLRAGWLRAVLDGLVAGGGKRGVGSVDPGEVRKAGPKVRGEALRPGRCPKMAPPLVPQHLPREDASQAKLPWTPLPPHLTLLLSFS